MTLYFFLSDRKSGCNITNYFFKRRKLHIFFPKKGNILRISVHFMFEVQIYDFIFDFAPLHCNRFFFQRSFSIWKQKYAGWATYRFNLRH